MVLRGPPNLAHRAARLSGLCRARPRCPLLCWPLILFFVSGPPKANRDCQSRICDRIPDAFRFCFVPSHSLRLLRLIPVSRGAAVLFLHHQQSLRHVLVRGSSVLNEALPAGLECRTPPETAAPFP